jgi:hypothetical protein
MRLKDLVLFGRRQAGVQGQDLGLAAVAGNRTAAERLGGLADVPLGGQKDQHVAGAGAGEFLDRIGDRALQVELSAGVFVRLQRLIADLDRVRSPGHFDDRRRPASPRASEMRSEPLGIDRGRGDDQLQVSSHAQQPLDVAQQKVDIQRSLVGLVDNQRVVLVQEAFLLCLG